MMVQYNQKINIQDGSVDVRPSDAQHGAYDIYPVRNDCYSHSIILILTSRQIRFGCLSIVWNIRSHINDKRNIIKSVTEVITSEKSVKC